MRSFSGFQRREERRMPCIMLPITLSWMGENGYVMDENSADERQQGRRASS